jgi:hypothetical protein
MGGLIRGEIPGEEAMFFVKLIHIERWCQARNAEFLAAKHGCREALEVADTSWGIYACVRAVRTPDAARL